MTWPTRWSTAAAQRTDELEGRVGGADVVDLGAGRHQMHRLEVESLLAVPALAVLLVAGMVATVEDLLLELHGRQAVAPAVGVHVLADRGRGERIDDRDRLARAIVAVLDRAAHAVGTLELMRAVAAGGPGLRLAVGRRHLLAVPARPVMAARSRVPEGRGRRSPGAVSAEMPRGWAGSSASPATPTMSPDSLAGIDTGSAGARSRWPSDLKTLSEVLKARSTLPAVPVALTSILLFETSVTSKPWLVSQRLTLVT